MSRHVNSSLRTEIGAVQLVILTITVNDNST